MVTVYGLASTRDRKIRYVGQTNREVQRRFYRHTDDARSGKQTYCCRWIRKELAGGFKVYPFVIERDVVYNDAEIRWIAFYKRAGAELVNHTMGGKGSVGFKLSAETCAKKSAALIGRKLVMTPKRIAAIKYNLHKMLSDPDRARKISKARMGMVIPPESIAKRTATRRANARVSA
jgi:hypothetical protein